MLSKILHGIAYEYLKEQERPKFRMRPSKAGREKCIRQTVYEGLGYPAKPLPGRSAITLDDGNWHHELVKDWIRQSAYQLHSEEMTVTTRVGPGHIDGILTDIISKDRLLEIKSINHFSYERLLVGEWPLDYLDQVGLYLDSEELSDAGITNAVLLFKNKNQGAYTDITVRYDKETDSLHVLSLERSSGEVEKYEDCVYTDIVAAAVEKERLIKEHVQNKTIPKRAYHWSHWRCQYCQFHELCWQEWEKESLSLESNIELNDEFETAIRYRGELAQEKKEIDIKYQEITDQLRDVLERHKASSGLTTTYEVYIPPMRKVFDRTKLTKSEIDRATVYVPNQNPKVRKRKDLKPEKKS